MSNPLASGRLRFMTHRPVYAGQGGIGLALVSWLVGVLPTGRDGLVTGATIPAPPDGVLVANSPSGCVAWDAALAQPVAAIDVTGEVWLGDGVGDEPAVADALALRGYRRGEMRVTRRVVSPDGGTSSMFRATQWTNAAVRAAASDRAGAVWK